MIERALDPHLVRWHGSDEHGSWAVLIGDVWTRLPVAHRPTWQRREGDRFAGWATACGSFRGAYSRELTVMPSDHAARFARACCRCWPAP